MYNYLAQNIEGHQPDMYDGVEYNRLFGYTYHLRSYLIFWTLTFFIHICRIPAILTDITKNSKEKRGSATCSLDQPLEEHRQLC